MDEDYNLISSVRDLWEFQESLPYRFKPPSIVITIYNFIILTWEGDDFLFMIILEGNNLIKFIYIDTSASPWKAEEGFNSLENTGFILNYYGLDERIAFYDP